MGLEGDQETFELKTHGFTSYWEISKAEWISVNNLNCGRFGWIQTSETSVMEFFNF